MNEKIFTKGNIPKENVIAKGRIFELIQLKQPDGRIFEIARRAPGVRLIIADKTKQKVLLTKEYRHELKDWDYRLPGGKVFDTLDEYEAHRNKRGDILNAATYKAKAEAAEEAGVEVHNLVLYKKSTLGATVEWDLFVFEVTSWNAHSMGQQLEKGEEIETDNWFRYQEAKKMILAGKMQEERIALILLQWLNTQENKI